jgi:hypothetical protein
MAGPLSAIYDIYQTGNLVRPWHGSRLWRGLAQAREGAWLRLGRRKTPATL